MQLRRPTASSLWIALAWALCTWVVLRGWFDTGTAVVPLAMHGSWIASANPEGEVTQFRKTLVIGGAPRSAWIAIAADEGFELVVNGVVAGGIPVSHTSRPFQTGLTERGQRVGVPDPTIDLVFPYDYQWLGERSYLLPTFFDVGPLLRSGRNAVCVEVEARTPPARVLIDGEVVLWSGEHVSLASDESYRAKATPPEDGRHWTEAIYDDLDWPPAVTVDAPPGELRTALDPAVFSEPFAGSWIHAPQANERATWLESTWSLRGDAARGWLRILSDRPYVLFVNDVPVRPNVARAGDTDMGEWTVGGPRALDAPVTPGTMPGPAEPSESTAPAAPAAPPTVQHPFAGLAAADTLKSGSLLPDPFAPPDVVRPLAAPGGPAGPQAPSKHAPSAPVLSTGPDLDAPPASFRAYGIDRLLVGGDNRITLRMSATDPALPAETWPARVAVDGLATLEDGSRVPLPDPGYWTAWTQAPNGTVSRPTPAALAGLATGPGLSMQGLEYRGNAELASWKTSFLGPSAAVATLACALLSLLPTAMRALRRRRLGQPPFAPPSQAEGDLLGADRLWILVVFTVPLACALLLRLAWRERDDFLSLLDPDVWRALAIASFAVAGAVGVALGLRRAPRRSLLEGLMALSWSRAPAVAIGVIVVACGFMRAYRLDAQPWQDDEMASTQAALAIADHGTPEYTPEVYYTRSPLYHYLVGGAVRVFGHNIWALRMPSVLFAAATVYLVYLFGARLLGSRSTGVVAAALLTLHPYGVYVGHFVRFYQQQQFFALLALYFFCRGFVGQQQPRARLLAVAAFLAACLSQEISVVMAVPLLFAWALFGKSIDRRSAIAFWVAGGCAAVVLGVDMAVAATACFTKVEGISPNIDVTIAPHFANPLHFLTLFVAHSRLHLVLSLVLLAGVPLIISGPDRNAVALLVVLVCGTVAVNLLVTLEAVRYLFWLFPVWMLLGVYALRSLVLYGVEHAAHSPLAGDWLAPAMGAMVLLTVLASWSPWRMAGSWGAAVVGDSTSAFSYVRTHLRPGDAVAVTEPHPPGALVEIGQVDYDLSVPLVDEYVYRRDGKLVDRNAGAEVISSLEGLESAVATHDRLWVVLDRVKMQSRGQEILWQLPGARIEAFLRDSFELKHQSFDYAVFLWDAHVGRYRSVREHGLPSL